MLSHSVSFQPFNPVLQSLLRAITVHFLGYFPLRSELVRCIIRKKRIMKRNEQHKYDKTRGKLSILRIARTLRAYQRDPLIYVFTMSHHRSRARQRKEERGGFLWFVLHLLIIPASGGHHREFHYHAESALFALQRVKRIEIAELIPQKDFLKPKFGWYEIKRGC